MWLLNSSSKFGKQRPSFSLKFHFATQQAKNQHEESTKIISAATPFHEKEESIIILYLYFIQGDMFGATRAKRKFQ